MIIDNVKWLFFDLGSTLINEDKAHSSRIKATVNSHKEKGRCLTYEQIFNEMVKASENYQQPYPTAVKSLHIDYTAPYPKELELPYADTHYVLEELHKKYKMGIIANQSAGTEKRLEENGLLKYFDKVFSSTELGLSKPDLAFFEYALKDASAIASESVMIGDRLDNDIYPAKKIGMNTIWIKQGFGAYQIPKSKEYEPDLTIYHLTQLINILK